MAVYFAFSDENGSYCQIPGRRFLRAHPYFVRATFMMPAEEWKGLNDQFRALKRRFGLPLDREIKWAYLWSLRSHQNNREPVPLSRPYAFLSSYDHAALHEFVEGGLGLLATLSFVRIIVTVTDNSTCPAISEQAMCRMHLQEAMQRIQMELQCARDNLGVLFVDPVSPERDELLRGAYSELFQSGDFIDYTHIKDSLNFEQSHHSVGIQLADYVAGCFLGFLRGYEVSGELFARFILPYLRRDGRGNVLGYGIREVPRAAAFRTRLGERLAVAPVT